MKTITILFTTVFIFVFSLNIYAQDSDDSGVVTSDKETDVKSDDITEVKAEDPVGVRVKSGMLYGNAFEEKLTVVSYEELVGAIDDYNEQTFVLTGIINEVCQKAGCWFTMGEGDEQVRVMTKHEFFVPKNSGGKNATVAGVLKVTEISEDQARHFNEESENPVDPEEISGLQNTYIFDASGVILSD